MPLTFSMDGLVTPVVVRIKSPMFTPVTAFENVTVKFTLAALVGLSSARIMLTTTGGAIVVGLLVCVLVAVEVNVGVGVAVSVGVSVGVEVAVSVGVGVLVAVGVPLGVGVSRPGMLIS